MLIKEMYIFRLMSHDQQIKKEKLKESARGIRRTRSDIGDHSQ